MSWPVFSSTKQPHSRPSCFSFEFIGRHRTITRTHSLQRGQHSIKQNSRSYLAFPSAFAVFRMSWKVRVRVTKNKQTARYIQTLLSPPAVAMMQIFCIYRNDHECYINMLYCYYCSSISTVSSPNFSIVFVLPILNKGVLL